MEILDGVGDEVMAPVMSRPPERALLIRRCSRKRDQELEKPAGPVGAVSQQTMKPGGDRKHADDVQSQTSSYCYHAYPCPDNKQTRQVQEEKLHAEVRNQFVMVERGRIFEFMY